MIQIEGIRKVNCKQNNIRYIGNEDYMIGKEEGQGRTKASRYFVSDVSYDFALGG